MNGVHHHNVRKHDFEKMYPGRLGRMTDLFESSTGSISGASIMSPSGDPRESVSNNRFQNRKSYVTPMRTLIAQEMSTEEDPKGSSPNLVAKLMGIDIFPRHEPGSTTQRSHSRIHARSYSDIPTKKDVQEGWQQSPKSQHKGKYEEETMNDRKMNLIRQKFVEVKRLSMDEKLRQSKQFHDALDVLSSNKDLFLKCLHEPNSKELYSLHPAPETNRITVLRPSKLTNGNNNDSAGARYRDEQQINRGTFRGLNKPEKTHSNTSPVANLEGDGNSTQPTRIVVLKPNPRKPQHKGKAMGSPKSSFPNILLGEDFFGDEEDEECREAREVAKEITQKMHEKLGMHRRDETLISSVFSNGYVGDESSFNKSDTEFMSPVSRRSWDYADRIGSPYSPSFYTRASYSPESSVSREAKKRLSERWANMASSESFQEQLLFQRSSSTLGDMLALSEIKKEAYTTEEPENSDAHLDSEHRRREEGNVDYSSRNLMRSKSVPVSNMEFETRLNVGISDVDKRKPGFSKDTKGKGIKSSIRGKVSSLFYSRNKESGIHKFASCIDETQSFSGEFCNEKGLDCATPGLPEPNQIHKQGMVSPESGFAVAEFIASGETHGKHYQRSLVSVDIPLEENEPTSKVPCHYVNDHDQQGIERPLTSIRPNLIDKSPLIGSIACTLTRDNSCVNNSVPHPFSETLTAPKEDEYQECFFFVKTLLSMSGLEGKVKANPFFSRWHSPESPLDPSLRDSYIDGLNDKLWKKRSSQKLMFDCVNEVLIDIAEHKLESGLREIGPGSCVLEEVWARMKVCFFSSPDECVLSGDSDVMVDRVVRKEVMGKVWNSHLRSEIDEWRIEIGGKLLEELVQEMVDELTGRKSDWNASSF